MAELETNVRPMKWHIYGPENHPLCWDDKALEFDTNVDAREFLKTAMDNSLWSEDFWVEAEIKENILYYDGGYMDATNLRVGWDEYNGEECLVTKEYKIRVN